MSEAKKHQTYGAEKDEAPNGVRHGAADDAGAGLAEEAAGYEDGADALEAEMAALREERDQMRDRLMRALADAENSRKRAEKDRREGLLYGGSKLARDMLSVYDHLSRAVQSADDDTRANAQAHFEGIDLTLRELLNILARHGVERVSPEPGDPFDPHLHQAMFEAPVANVPPGQVIQVLADGFRMHEQLLRPAQVGVSAGTAGS